MVFPVLGTKRLILRRLTNDDYPEIFALRSSDQVNRYISRAKATKPEEAKEFIRKINDGIDEDKCFYWAICFRSSSQLIGTICLWNFSEDKKTAEAGYELQPQYQGQGIMNESIEAIIHFAFAETGINTLLAFTHKQNSSSYRLLEKNNFCIDRHLKDDDNPDNIVYRLTNNRS